MSSFYGGGGTGGGSGGSGTTSLTGTSEYPIIFSDLDYGNYSIDGYYQYTQTSDTELADYDLSVLITRDKVTGHKIAQFTTVENNVCYIHTVDLYTGEESSTATQHPIVFTTKEELPAQGNENTLYVTDEKIYRYINDEWVAIGGGSIEWIDF